MDKQAEPLLGDIQSKCPVQFITMDVGRTAPRLCQSTSHWVATTGHAALVASKCKFSLSRRPVDAVQKTPV
jgi:hypothetical protein